MKIILDAGSIPAISTIFATHYVESKCLKKGKWFYIVCYMPSNFMVFVGPLLNHVLNAVFVSSIHTEYFLLVNGEPGIVIKTEVFVFMCG